MFSTNNMKKLPRPKKELVEVRVLTEGKMLEKVTKVRLKEVMSELDLKEIRHH